MFVRRRQTKRLSSRFANHQPAYAPTGLAAASARERRAGPRIGLAHRLGEEVRAIANPHATLGDSAHFFTKTMAQADARTAAAPATGTRP